ncbi:DUF3558 domain-containing protein [Saccharomonospora xinjiangensis]|uniref:DUF3558 domain-containing protein n=1 Tax=Saccharomonospora xinjiangensis TaxID=75294 RepID=UPI00350EFFBE
MTSSKAGFIVAMVGAISLSFASGCSTKEEGIAQTQPRTEPPSRTSATSALPSADQSSSSIDPCALLSASDLSDAGEFQSEYSDDGSARSCYWQRSAVGGGEVFTFALSVRDTQGIDTMNDYGGGITEDVINHRPVAVAKDPGNGDCTLAMKIGDSSRVDVTILDKGGEDDACQVAEVIAEMVEPRLPEIR